MAPRASTQDSNQRHTALLFEYSTKSSQCFLLLALLVFMSACTPIFATPKHSPEERARRGLATLMVLHKQLQSWEQPSAQSYIDSVLAGIEQSIPASKQHPRFRATLLRSSAPFSGSIGGGLLLITTGMICTLERESELAFVLSHEMAHEILEHPLEQTTQHEWWSRDLTLEFSADEYGLGLMARASYDPRYGASGLTRVAEALNAGVTQAVEERVRRIEDAIIASRWGPPGIIDRREFHKIRRSACADVG